MAASPAHRVFLRHQLQMLRWQRSRAPARRWQSSKPQPTRTDDPVPIANTVATLPLWQRLGPLTRVAEAYARAQRRRPYVTQLCSALVIYFCADLSAQRMSKKDYDATRTARSLLIGAISSIPSYRWCVPLPTPTSTDPLLTPVPCWAERQKG